MITSRRMAVLDRNAEYLGVSTAKLMENAGAGVAEAVRNQEPDDVLVVAGRGNNGGDALVAARHLDELKVKVRLLGRAENASPLTRENWEALEASETDAREVRDSTELDEKEFMEADVVVDGVLGTGVTGGLREPATSAVELMNSSDASVVSVDVPSGVDPDTGDATAAVDADVVVTFHDLKPAHPEIEAEVRVVDIGIPGAAERFVGVGDLQLVNRSPDSHKGENGYVLVVGGGPYTGAPALSSLAALRSGADLAFAAVPGNAARAVESYSPDLIVRRLDGTQLEPMHVDRVLGIAEDCDSIVVGPGLGDKDETLEAARSILEGVGSAVVDADAIRVLRDVDTEGKDVVVTPHAGELGRFVDVPDGWRERMGVVEEFASRNDVTVLLKGRYDVVSDGEVTRVSRTGNPGMTVGGTGDVLAGVTGSLLTQLEPVDAACVAAFVNGRAGDRAYGEKGYGLLASDVVERLPVAMRPTE